MLRSLTRRPTCAWLGIGLLTIFVGCKSGDAPNPPVDSGATGPCDDPVDANKAIRFAPLALAVAPGESRTVRVYIEPDVCGQTPTIFGDRLPRHRHLRRRLREEDLDVIALVQQYGQHRGSGSALDK